MFDPNTGVPTSKEAEVLISLSWTNDEDAASAHEFRIPYNVLKTAIMAFLRQCELVGEDLVRFSAAKSTV